MQEDATSEGSHDSSDDALVARAVAGDASALEALLRQHAVELCESVAIDRRWNRSFDRDDLVQVSSIEAILRIRSLRIETVAGFRAWFRRVVENNAKDAIRHLGARKRSPAEGRVTRSADGHSARTLLNALAGDGPSASRIVGGREEVARLTAAVGRLPTTYRRVVELVDLEERDVDEAATELGRSTGAVYMLRARAHERLRELLAQAK